MKKQSQILFSFYKSQSQPEKNNPTAFAIHLFDFKKKKIWRKWLATTKKEKLYNKGETEIQDKKTVMFIKK